MLTDLVQTFYIDASAVNQATEVFITSIEVFFREKPVETRNTSGAKKPAVNLYLCSVSGQDPNADTPISETVRLTYDDIYAFSDASVPTVFSFKDPVVLRTNKFYGFVLKFEDQFKVWKNHQGDTLVGSNSKSSGATSLPNGRLYETDTKNKIRKFISASQLKFKVNIAKFQENTVSYLLSNKRYEFLSVSNTSGKFIGGETVYPVLASANGTVSVTSGSAKVTGVGTAFTALQENTDIVLKDGANTVVQRIESIINDTELYTTTINSFTNSAAEYYPAVTGEVFKYDALGGKLYLINSTANSVSKFANTVTVKGEISNASADIVSLDGLQVARFLPQVSMNSPSAVDPQLQYVIANSTVGSANTDYQKVKNNEINDTNGYIWSRSLEVSGSLVNDKSFNMKADFRLTTNSTALFSSPQIDLKQADVFVFEFNISNTTVVDGIDTETRNDGISKTRYLSQKIFFANNRFAEDAVVYLNAYRPANTEIKVYAKLHNSADTDAFEDKLWTPMELVENINKFSGSKDELIEYTYYLPKHSEASQTLLAKVSANGSAIVETTGDISSSVDANTVVNIYDPLFPENYHVRSVLSANSTAVVLDEEIDVTQSGLNIDILKYPTAAFRNKDGDFVARYYSTNRAAFDTFDTVQIKIVPLSSNTAVAPEIDYIQFVGTSA